MDIYPGKYPAVVRQYMGESRTCRIEIPGITDGAEVLPLAEIEYPIGDKSKAQGHATEIEILPGDAVWIEFIAGDPRYPVITGWRNPGAGNSTGWRRYHHANIEMTADGVLRLNATNIELNASASFVVKTPSATLDAQTTKATGSLSVAKGFTYAQGMSGSGGGTVDGVSIPDHTHGGVRGGGDQSAPPTK